ncbi:hypothetical protein [Ancylobacter radicis]
MDGGAAFYRWRGCIFLCSFCKSKSRRKVHVNKAERESVGRSEFMGALVIGVGVAVAVIGIVFGAWGFSSSETTSGAAILMSGSIGFVGGLLLVAMGLVQRSLVVVADRLDGIIQFEEEEASHLHGQLQAPLQSPLQDREHGHGAGLELEAEDFLPVFPPISEPAPPPPAKPAKRTPPPVPAAPARQIQPEPEPEPEPEEAIAPAAVVAEERPLDPAGGLPSWFRRKREPEPVPEPEIEAQPEIAEPALQFEPLPPPRPASEAARAELARREEAAQREADVAARRELPPFLRSGPPSAPGERAAVPERPVAPERPMPVGFAADRAESHPAEPRVSEPRISEPRMSEPRVPEPRRAPEPRLSEPRIADPRIAEPRIPEPRIAAPRVPEPVVREPVVREPLPRADLGPDPGAPPAFLSVSDLLGDDEPAAEPEVSVLKSGVIGGMAYKLYSDGSIEADLPDGTLRFASLQDLRDHVSGGAARGED